MIKVPKKKQRKREKVTLLQEEIGSSLARDYAKIYQPCPVADEIFDQLFGRLWLQGVIIQRHVTAEDLLNIIKLDYEATLEFYKQRRASTFRETTYPEEDQELQGLLQDQRDAVDRIAALTAQLAALEERERVELAKWTGEHDVEEFVFTGRSETLQHRARNIQLRSSLLEANVDVLDGADELLSWANTALYGTPASLTVEQPPAEPTPQPTVDTEEADV